MKPPRLSLVLLTLTALLMPVASITVPVDSYESGPGQAVTPPGIFFSIWGLVIIGCLAVAMWGWIDSASPVLRAVAWPLVIAQAGYTVWLIFAGQQSAHPLLGSLGTVMTFAVILASLVVAMQRLGAAAGSRRWIVAVTIGIYAGWSSAAIWLNIVTDLPAAWADSPLAQSLAIAGAGATAVAIIIKVRPNPAYAAAVVWALVGISVAAAQAAAWAPFCVDVIGLVIVILAAVWTVRSSRTAKAVHVE